MIRAMSLILAATTLAFAIEPVKTKDIKQLKKEAIEATTGPEHLKAAEQWDARAIAFDGQAVKHERDADERARNTGYNAMRHKWPAMAQAPVEHLRGKAMQARRAANESRELAKYHREQAEKLAAGN